jgi:hypothetical protein
MGPNEDSLDQGLSDARVDRCPCPEDGYLSPNPKRLDLHQLTILLACDPVNRRIGCQVV